MRGDGGVRNHDDFYQEIPHKLELMKTIRITIPSLVQTHTHTWAEASSCYCLSTFPHKYIDESL